MQLKRKTTWTTMDFVICSYSLTMFPDWRAATERMVDSCRAGGYVCCTDFVVCGDHIVRYAIVQSAFACVNVRLNADHIRYQCCDQKLRNFRPPYLRSEMGIREY